MPSTLKTATALAAVLALTIPAASQGAARAASIVPPKHTVKKCRRGYHRVAVKVPLRRHGKVVHRHHRVVKVKKVVCRKKHSAQTVALAPLHKVTVGLDPNVGRDPSSPSAVTYNVGILEDTGLPLPHGLAHVYQDGLLKCSSGVGGTDLTSATESCPTSATVGRHELVVDYVADNVNLAATETSTVTVTPFTTSTTASLASDYTEVAPCAEGRRYQDTASAAVADQYGGARDSGPVTYALWDQTTGTKLLDRSDFFIYLDAGTDQIRVKAGNNPALCGTSDSIYVAKGDQLAVVATYPGEGGYAASSSQLVTVPTTAP